MEATPKTESAEARERRVTWILASLLLAVGTIAYARFVIQDFSGPLIGGRDYDGAYRGDANYFEFLGYYVRDHYAFGLRPISFLTDDVAFPGGTHIGLLSWCAERDLFHAAMLKLFGPGPWIQTYLTLGAALGAAGVTAILKREYGLLRASLVGFAASFMSFYAWYKYPYHLNICALHWVTMSIAADAVTMRVVARGDRLRVDFLALRAALVVCAVGLDLGYIAGHALTSLVVTVYCVWAHLGRRDKRILGRLSLALPEAPRAEIAAHKGRFVAACALFAFGAAVYVPFVAAVVRDTTAYPMTDAGGNFWASQFHALFPYLPGVHPGSRLVHAIFGDDEGIGEYAPGFTLLFGAGVGLWMAHKRGRVDVKPLLVTAILIFAFHPRWCKSLQIFPWFAYYRVAGRGTVVLPVLLALIAASVDEWPRLAKRVLIFFGVAEIATGWLLVSEFHPERLEPRHRRYFETVAAAPGKGILEWPFCISSANSVMERELCPYFERLSTAYAYRRFHGKSTISVYLSRVHPTQFQSWLDGGWEDMFSPDDPKRRHAKKESRCFDAAQWARFDELYTRHDFAGIQLYVDLLPEPCVALFHERYGAPLASETLPRVGRVEFIPRAAEGPRPRGSD
ncbi:MAG: hypothetical protein KF819_22305 [Labilithrix sp.]|nr:hypothetical protein [Labilithrix sp.]